MKPEDEQRRGPLVQIEGLKKHYVQPLGWPRAPRIVNALDGVDLTLNKRSTLALVGESGSGKSTLARCLAMHELPDSGKILLEGTDLVGLGRKDRRSFRRRVQLIFQDPTRAVNPRLTALEIVVEPLRIRDHGDPSEQRRRALAMMDRVGLLPRWATRLPSELSGGQRQRLAIARGLVLEPDILILDEAFSALDPSVGAQIANLLLDLQASEELTYLLIAHDLALASHLAHEIAVMYRGKLVERASPEGLLSEPRHRHSRDLVAASPGFGGAPWSA